MTQEVLDEMPTPKIAGTILSEADQLTSQDRQRLYGPPEENHSVVAAFWTSYLIRRGLLPEHQILKPRDVCLMMVLLKIGRDAHTPTRDNLVDMCGYARNAEQLVRTP